MATAQATVHMHTYIVFTIELQVEYQHSELIMAFVLTGTGFEIKCVKMYPALHVHIAHLYRSVCSCIEYNADCLIINGHLFIYRIN